LVLLELIPRLDQATLGGVVANLALSKVKSCEILKCHKNKEIHPCYQVFFMPYKQGRTA